MTKTSNLGSPQKRSGRRVFIGIRELYTLQGAARKQGRHIEADDLGCIKNAALVIEGDRIVWVGAEDQLAKHNDDVVENLGGVVVTPAFVECHTHLVYAGNRAGEFERRNQGETYKSIAESGGGILSTVRATRETPEDELLALAQKRVQRFLKQGVTTIEVKSGYALTVEAECKMLRAAGRLQNARIVRTFLGAHAIPKDTTADAYLKTLVDEAFPRLKAENLCERVDIFIEQGYFNRTQGEAYLQAAKQHGFDVVIHADQMTLSGGAELAVQLSARSADHLLQITEKEISKIAKSETTAVLLPSSDLYTKTPYPPARELIDQGARVALATDYNPGTCPSPDLALVGVLARIVMKMSFAEVVAAYTVGAAYALGLEKEIGTLAPGYAADFCILENGIEELFLDVGHMPIHAVYRQGLRVI